MNASFCSNYQVCRLVTTDIVTSSDKQKQEYIESYCEASRETWQSCKRFVTKDALGFCPDFVLPDTNLGINEIIDKFDELKK